MPFPPSKLCSLFRTTTPPSAVMMPPAPVTLLPTAPSALPEWLAKGRSEAYIYDAFAALSIRERHRHYARTMSLGGSTSSQLVGALPREDNEHNSYYSAAIGGNLGNQWANRYSNIWPYNRTRVIVGRQGGCTLGSNEGAGQGRYFNGNWVKELYGERLWIATQAPLRETAHSFLSIIARPIAESPPSSAIDLPAGSRIRTVVQLTVNFENGRQKASSYFPSDVKPMMRILPEPDCNAPAFRVALLEQKIIKKANCMQSKVSIIPDVANPGEPVVFTHMLYMAWPDQGVPEQKDLASLLYFIRLVDFVNRTPTEYSNDEPGPPLMVHCSAGVGRTGTFITLVSLLRTLGLLSTSSQPALKPIPSVRVPHSPLGPLQKEIQDDPVAQEIDNLREQRPRMVERIEQMQLIYEILELAISEKSIV